MAIERPPVGPARDRDEVGSYEHTGVPGDGEFSELDLHLRLEEVEASERWDSARWLAVFAGFLSVGLLAPESAVAAGLLFAVVALAATGTGFLQVRRRQWRKAVEAELEQHRRELLEAAADPARRLAILHEDLDRLRSRPTHTRAAGLAGLAAVLLVVLGLSEGIQWVAFTGVFFGLAAAFGVSRVLDRRQKERALLDEIDAE